MSDGLGGLEDLEGYGGRYSDRGEFREFSSEVVEGDYRDLSAATGYLGFNGETPVLEDYVVDTDRKMLMVDDHNHALAGWTAALYEGLFDSKPVLIHVDYHEDAGNPPQDFDSELPLTVEGLEEQVHLLEIDEFIEAGRRWDLFDEVVNVGVQSTDTDLDSELQAMDDALRDYDSAIMDIDLDVYNRHGLGHEFDGRIARGIAESDFTTFATSPGYMLDQEEAVEKIGGLTRLSEEFR